MRKVRSRAAQQNAYRVANGQHIDNVHVYIYAYAGAAAWRSAHVVSRQSVMRPTVLDHGAAIV